MKNKKRRRTEGEKENEDPSPESNNNENDGGGESTKDKPAKSNPSQDKLDDGTGKVSLKSRLRRYCSIM